MNKVADCFQQDPALTNAVHVIICMILWTHLYCGDTQVRTNACKPGALNMQQRNTSSSEKKIFYFHANVPNVLKQKEMLRKYMQYKLLVL